MITLLLTLFICVFSYCPSINIIEDHKENTINVNDSLTKYAYRDNGLTTFNYSEMATEQFYLTVIDTMRHSEINPEFVALGGTITLNNLNGAYNTYLVDGVPTYLSDMYSITLYYDRSLDDYWLFYIDFIHTSSGYDTKVFCEIFNGDSTFPTYRCHVEYSYFVIDNSYNRLFSYTFDSELINYFEIPSSYENGYNQGYYEGFNNGKTVGYNNGKADGISSGYQTGYTDGYNEGFQVDPTAATIFNGVLEIGLLPVNFFLSIFNFEVFGINIKSIVSGLLTVAVIIIIIRFLFGGKDNDK